MDLPWRLLAEDWGRNWIGFVVELPGCQFAANTRDELLARAPAAIAAHLAWLRARGLHGIDRSPEQFVLLETAQALPGGRGPLFDADRRQLTATECDAALRVGTAAVEDLLALAACCRGWETLPETERPPGRTPAEILRHIAEKDCWYAGRLMPDVGAIGLPVDPEEAVRTANQALVSSLRAWWALWGNRVVEREGESWTVAKVLRRRTGHLREHAGQLMAWVSAVRKGKPAT